MSEETPLAFIAAYAFARESELASAARLSVSTPCFPSIRHLVQNSGFGIRVKRVVFSVYRLEFGFEGLGFRRCLELELRALDCWS